MSVVGYDPEPGRCVNHPRRETRLRCGKCGDLICTRCVVQTPVGARCKQCAQVRKLPQFEVGPWLLVRATAAGLAVSTLAWFLLNYIVFLRFFLSILVGIAVGETVSRLARRRANRPLEVLTVAAVVAGLALAEVWRYRDNFRGLVDQLSNSPSALLMLVLPAAIASYVAVVKLR